MAFLVSNPPLKIDDQSVAYVSNSLDINYGYGTGSVVVSSIGGGRVKRDFSQDDSSKKIEIMFKMTVTPENIALATQWKQNFDNGITSVVQFGEDVEDNMCFTGEFKASLQHEGSFDVIFEKGN